MVPSVVFEDEYVMVLDKPAGMVVNKAESVKAETVQDWVEREYQSKIERAGIVHRLDKETSGLLIVARTGEAFEKLQSQFKERTVKKKYVALAHGLVKEDRGKITGEVGRLPWNRERFGVMSDGREAETDFEVIERLGGEASEADKRKHPGKDFGYTLLALFPRTGRTHQIRVHLKSIGHPVVGDEFYAGRKTAREDRKWCPRLFLHAAAIEFKHPVSGEEVKLESELPEDLKGALRGITPLPSGFRS